MKTPSAERGYCHDCKVLITKPLFSSHHRHKLKVNIDNALLAKPTNLLLPLSNDKREAQYFFADTTLRDIGRILAGLKIKYSVHSLVPFLHRVKITQMFFFSSKVVCIGGPRLHEFLKSVSIKSILLDFDDRFYAFYGANEFFRYNMFNHYFFDGPDSETNFEQFLRNDW